MSWESLIVHQHGRSSSELVIVRAARWWLSAEGRSNCLTIEYLGPIMTHARVRFLVAMESAARVCARVRLCDNELHAGPSPLPQ